MFLNAIVSTCGGEVHEEPIPILKPKLDLSGSIDTYALRNIISRGFNKNQLIILKEIKASSGKSLTAVLRGISKHYGIPLSTLKLNAKILKDLNLIYVNPVSRSVMLTPLGDFITELLGLNSFTDIRTVTLDREITDKLNEKLGLARKYLLDVVAEGSINRVLQGVTDVLVALQLARLHNQSYVSLSDRLIVSKQFLPAVYASLAALNLGCEERLSKLMDMRNLSNFSVVTTSDITIVLVPPNQCLPIGCGIALALRRESIYLGTRVYVLLDGRELSESYLWDVALLATKYMLDNIVVIAYATEYLGSSTLALKWTSLGWRAIEINHSDIAKVVNIFNMLNTVTGKPTIILIHTNPNYVAEVGSELGRDDDEVNAI